MLIMLKKLNDKHRYIKFLVRGIFLKGRRKKNVLNVNKFLEMFSISDLVLKFEKH